MRRKLKQGCAEFDHGHLAWPFFESRHRELAEALLEVVVDHDGGDTDGDTGRGVGASHQTGWSALVANMIAELHD